MSTDDPRELISEVACDVIAALGRCQPDGVEVRDVEIGGIRERGVRDESEGLNVGGRLVVVEDLVEVIDTHEDLVGYRWREDVVIDDGDVLDVDGRFLVVGEELGSDGSNLIALTDEPVGT